MKGGIHLTQVTTTGSVAGHGRLSAHAGGLRKALPIGGSLSRLSFPGALAGRVPLPPVWGKQGVAAAFCALAVCELRVPSFVDCGDDFSGHAHPCEGVVPRSVVDDQPEEWRQRARSATRVGARCAWQRGTYGWLVGLPASRQQRLPTSDHGLARPTPPFGIAAARPSGHLAVETLAAGHASRGRPSGTCG